MDWLSLVLYEDENLVVASKPHGIPAAPTPLGESGTLSHELSRTLGDNLVVVHRIDADTSGLIVFARHRRAARLLTEAFQQHRVRKFYLAVVQGQPREGDIRLPICRAGGGLRRVCPDGDHALTRVISVRPLDGSHTGHSLAVLELVTGRTHQIRVHMSHLGHPVVGDRLYGTAGHRLMLHAWHMKLEDRKLGTHAWTAPLPDHWQGIPVPDVNDIPV